MMNKEIKELLDCFSTETVENILTETKEDNFKPYNELTQLDIEHYLDERKGKEVFNSV